MIIDLYHINPPLVITIDGGAGTGKGTLATFLSRLLKIPHLDSGLLYRAVGYLVWKYSIHLDNIEALEHLAHSLDIKKEGSVIFVNGDECTKQIRSDKVGGLYASKVAQIPQVRSALKKFQLSMRKHPGLVADGRDQGFLFDTPYRFFLKTSPEVRAKRRMLQFQQMGISANYQNILEEIVRRDESDLYNPASPLLPHPEAREIKNDYLTVKEAAKIVVAHCFNVFDMNKGYIPA